MSETLYNSPTATIDPRVEFYRATAFWPRDSYKYRFLGRVVHDVGQLLFKEQWTGDEPATVLVYPVRSRLDSATPPQDIYIGISILLEFHAGYQQRASAALRDGAAHPMPTLDEWAVAAAISLQYSHNAWAAYKRYVAVCEVLVTAFELGRIVTALRPHLAGGPAAIDPSQWINECYLAWFSTCQLDPENPFARIPLRWGGSWWYVDKASLYAWILSTFDVSLRDGSGEPSSKTSSEPKAEQPVSNETSKPAKPQSDVPPKSKGGAKERYKWTEFDEEVLRVYRSNDRPISTHAFADRMLEWCSIAWNAEPGKSTVRRRIKTIMDRNSFRLDCEPVASNS
jgi:hypothetical protein